MTGGGVWCTYMACVPWVTQLTFDVIICGKNIGLTRKLLAACTLSLEVAAIEVDLSTRSARDLERNTC